jgi:serine/threonine protein kinase
MPPPTQYGQKSSSPVVSASPPPDASQQGGYSGTTIQSQAPIQQNQSSQRRPAYLLHRDLVIGKGSYGQVCIASRGEAEGHSSSGRNGSGKRKKFACKCVVLRNDPKYIAKLQEEVNVLRELRGHENVIRLYDVFCVDNELFIITELGRGGDLFHLLTTHPKHGVTEAYAGK